MISSLRNSVLKSNQVYVLTVRQYLGENSGRSFYLQFQDAYRRSFLGIQNVWNILVLGKRGGLMVSALYSGSNGLGSSPGRGHCVVFLSKTLS